jgi:uncharacterized protein (TIGR02594 family)
VVIETSLYRTAINLEGMREIPGPEDNQFLAWCLSLTTIPKPYHKDETPWCSAFLNGLCYILGLHRSGSAAARSWLKEGKPVGLHDALVGMDIVILKRGPKPQPGPEVLDAPGHVGIFAGYDGGSGIRVLGGNQGDRVSVATFPLEDVLGIRRLQPFG